MSSDALARAREIAAKLSGKNLDLEVSFFFVDSFALFP